MSAVYKNANVMSGGSAEAREYLAQRGAQASNPTAHTTVAKSASSPGGLIARMSSAMPKALGRTGTAAGLLAAAPEVYDTATVAQNKNATAFDVATQASEGAGRWASTAAGAALGAKGGAALGTLGGPFAPITVPIGGVVGGLAGAALGNWGADKAIRAGREFAGADTESPVDRLPTAAAAGVPGGTAEPVARSIAIVAGAGRGSINPAPVNPSAPTPQAPSLTNNITKTMGADGVASYSGENISDGFTLNGKATGGMLGGGAISPQNMSAADRLGGSNSLMSRAGLNFGGTDSPAQAPTVAHSGNDFTSREALRRAKMDASSLIHQSHWAKKGSGQAAQKAYAEMQQADHAAMTQGQAGANIETMRQNAGLQQEGMRQAGADRREGRRSLIDAARLGMEQETQGFANRAASQQEQLRNTLLDPQATPQQRAIAQRSLAALSGKTAADRMQAVNLPDTTTDNGSVVRGGQALVRMLDDGTVQQVPISPAVNTRQVPQEAIDELRKDPKAAWQFDEIFGQGASRQYLH